MSAYYNEIDPFAAEWLRELIRAGLIAPGDVDERSIEDVQAVDLAGYDQCHFFSGIGGWSYALRLAGWPDDRPVWTGSCPCQPFSIAGKQAGFADERHLWPAFSRLIQQRRPHVVFGEQVAGRNGRAWFDLVLADLEALGYACGAVDTPACGYGAPHIRSRLYWVADAASGKLDGGGEAQFRGQPANGGGVCGMVHADRERRNRGGNAGQGRRAEPANTGASGGLVHPDGDGRGAGQWHHPPLGHRHTAGAAGEPRGFWAEHEWRWCRDGKWRPIEPGLEPLADGLPGRVAVLRGIGNAIVPQQAAAFIGAVMEYAEARP